MKISGSMASMALLAGMGGSHIEMPYINQPGQHKANRSWEVSVLLQEKARIKRERKAAKRLATQPS